MRFLHTKPFISRYQPFETQISHGTCNNKLSFYMETSATINNMNTSNRISACIYIFEIRNQHNSFPIFILFFFLFLLFSCFWNSLLLAFPPFLRWFINMHLPLWVAAFTSPAEHAPRIESNLVCRICCEKERVVLGTDLKMGSAHLPLLTHCLPAEIIFLHYLCIQKQSRTVTVTEQVTLTVPPESTTWKPVSTQLTRCSAAAPAEPFNCCLHSCCCEGSEEGEG